GWPEQEIPVGSDRAPKWPEGLTGSISHSKEWALVAITTEANGRVGVDVEHREHLEEPLWEMVFTETEVARWKGLSREEQLRCALVGFCAKEAVYKAQYGWTGSFLGFHAVEVELSGCADRVGDFSCTFRQDVRPSKFDGGRAFRAGERVRVRYLLNWLEGAPVIVGAWIKG
ncbi:MAG: 4'-phosphopantetheinyl transferase superfamily protein, partial [Deltaproteobacteria bacterium]|nr:4'-phosphopantetheinyl transferase superfamily protein [Deltaproteobacteria bacterium]